MKYQNELRVIEENIKKIFEETSNNFTTENKGEQDIVTSNDLYIERRLTEVIKKSFPEDYFHTEEYFNETKLQDRTWIIDPIDGTSNYARGLELFVMQLALYDKGDIVFSYIYAPIFAKTYYAIKGEGAYLNGKKFSLSKEMNTNNIMLSLVGFTHKTPDKTYYHKLLSSAIIHKYKLRMLGSIGLELALMSEGVYDMFYSNVTNIWDLYPGILLLREAGAILLNERMEDYRLNDLNLFVARNNEVKEILKDMIRMKGN
jgi:myo-inositol-1(or 4)-monophosphatase